MTADEFVSIMSGPHRDDIIRLVLAAWKTEGKTREEVLALCKQLARETLSAEEAQAASRRLAEILRPSCET